MILLLSILVRGVATVEGAILGAMMVAVPCAAVWGSSGPSWPLVPLAVLAAAGAFGGWRLSRLFIEDLTC